MKMISLIKRSSLAGAAFLMLAGAWATGMVAPAAADELSAPAIMAKTRAAYAALSSYSDSGKTIYEMSGQKLALTFSTRLARPNLYRIDWTQDTGFKGTVWSDGGLNQLQLEPGSSPAAAAMMAALSAGGKKSGSNLQTLADMGTALKTAAALSYTTSATIPGAFFNQNCGDNFVYPALVGRYPVKPEADEMIGEVDCYRISAQMDLSQVPEAGKPGTVFTTLWIGKNDFLVHQCRARYVEKVAAGAGSSDQEIDEAIKKSLQMQNQPVTPEAVAAMRPQMKAIMKQVRANLKTAFQAGVVITQMHEHISVNQNLSALDFTR
jgi:hypothetical protein